MANVLIGGKKTHSMGRHHDINKAGNVWALNKLKNGKNRSSELDGEYVVAESPIGG
jgi:hypothetical protein